MNYFFLTNTPLFRGVREDEIEHLLSCLGAREKTYQKNEIIFRAGSAVSEIGLVQSGSVNIVVNFYWGNSNIFGHVEKGMIFAENYAAIPGKELLCDVVAAEPCEILFLKSLNLSSRMMHTAPKSIRDKLLSYLSEQAIVNSNTHFTIPFDRQQLADYLGVDRSALSNELSKMQKDGLISFKKNEFILHET